MINIAFIIDRMWDCTGGTEKQLLLLLEQLHREEFTPHLIVLRDTAWLRATKLPYPVFVLDMKSFRPAPLFRAVRAFRKYAKEHNISIVQTFFQDGNLFGVLAAFFCRVKVIIASRRAYGPGYWHSGRWLFILRVLRWMTTHYICNSTKVADYTLQREGAPASKVSVIYNGLVLDVFDRLTPEYRLARRDAMGYGPEDIVIGALTSFRLVKNLTLFVEAASIVHPKHQNTRFVIIGDGPERPEVEAMIDRYALRDVFRLVGEVRDVLPYLASLDIGVSCSLSEGLSNSIIEYTAAGVPCVVSDVGGSREAMGPNGGYTFESGNSLDFSGTLEKLILDEKLRSDIGRESREHAYETYHHKLMVRRHENLYRTLAESRGMRS